MVEMTYANAIKDAMSSEMRRDENVFLMGEDVGIYQGAFGVSGKMWQEFGDRVIDTPISETGFVGCAIGAAVEGMRPIVEIMFSDFMAVCWDMIINQAPKMHFMFGGKISVPMVIRTASGGGTGAAAQHSQSLEAMLCHVPGLKVVVPSTPYDAKGLLLSSIRDNNPVMFLEQKLLYRTKGMVEEGEYTIPLGVADIKRPGSDCTIVTYGRMVHTCLAAAEQLAKEGISAEVIDLRTLLPMDKQAIIDSVKKTGRLCIVHEAVKTGGLGGEIAASVAETEAFNYLAAPICRLASEDVPVPFCPTLEKGILPDEDKIINAIRDMCRSKSAKATPLAARMAADRGVSLSNITGSGHDGKVTKADILLEASSLAAATAGERREPMTGMRKVVAQRMLRSHTEIPPVTHIVKNDVTALLEARAKLNSADEGNRYSINDFVLKAVAKALASNRHMLVGIDGEEVIYKDEINIGMAVALDAGLIVPVIRGADRMSLGEISAAAKDLATRARNGKLNPDEYKGNTFTVSNLGMLDVEAFTPIINQPDAALLGVCAIQDELALAGANVVVRKMMRTCLTYDHRLLDGASAAAFQKEVKRLLENPIEIVM